MARHKLGVLFFFVVVDVSFFLTLSWEQLSQQLLLHLLDNCLLNRIESVFISELEREKEIAQNNRRVIRHIDF